jgi:fucose 4-O-acetylase-like acetyltransferase
MPSSRRDDWMDVLRGGAIVLVVAVHALELTVRFTGHEFTRLGSFTVVVTPLRLPMMFFLSGLLVPRSLMKGTVPYLAGKVRRVVYPYLLWSLLLIAMFALSERITGDGFGWDVLPRVFYDPIEHLWFLGYLFVYFLLALLIRWVPPSLLLLGAIGLSALPVDGQWLRLWANAAFFLAGVVVAGHRADFDRIIVRFWPCAAMLAAAIALQTGHALHVLQLPEAPWNLPVLLLFFVGAAGVVRPIASRPPLAPLRFTGVESIVFYIVHWPAQVFLLRELALTGMAPAAVLAIGLAVGIAVPALIALAARRVPAVAAAFAWPARAPRRRIIASPHHVIPPAAGGITWSGVVDHVDLVRFAASASSWRARTTRR